VFAPRRAVYANPPDVFINSLVRSLARARARARSKRGKSEKEKKGGRRAGARSRRIIKCVLPRKFIFILESIMRKRRRAREPHPLSAPRSFLSPLSRLSPPLAKSRRILRVLLQLPATRPPLALSGKGKTNGKPATATAHFEINCYARLYMHNARRAEAFRPTRTQKPEKNGALP